MPRSPAIVTQKTIAKLAKVSPGVVSTILNGHQGSIRYSAETAERVHAAARQLHYRPDRMAQALHSERRRVIGLLSSSIFALPPAFLHWLSLALGERDQVLVIQGLPPGGAAERCQILQERFVDAAICAELLPKAVQQRAMQVGLPLLFINADPDLAAARVLYDEVGGMRRIAEHLRQRGYRGIVLHDLGGDGYWIAERRKGFRVAAEALGLPPPRVVTTAVHGHLLGAAEAERLAAACTAGDAVVVQDSAILPFLMPRLQARGLRIPTDIGAVTLNHPPAMDLKWTCAEVNTRLLAGLATDILLAPDALQDKATQRVGYELHAEHSTART